jgi:hypothetical protein
VVARVARPQRDFRKRVMVISCLSPVWDSRLATSELEAFEILTAAFLNRLPLFEPAPVLWTPPI